MIQSGLDLVTVSLPTDPVTETNFDSASMETRFRATSLPRIRRIESFQLSDLTDLKTVLSPEKSSKDIQWHMTA